MNENKRLAGAEGIIFWTYTWIVVSYFFALSYLSNAFQSIIIDNPNLSSLVFNAQYITDLQHTSVLIAGLILTGGLALKIGDLKKPINWLKALPLLLFLVPMIASLGYFQCRYEIGGACANDSVIGIYVGSLLLLSLLIGFLLTRAPIPATAFKIALIPLAVVMIGSLYSMLVAVSWGQAALAMKDSLASDLLVLGNYDDLPGGWRSWISTGILLQVVFAALSVLGMGLSLSALFNKSKPAAAPAKKRR